MERGATTILLLTTIQTPEHRKKFESEGDENRNLMQSALTVPAKMGDAVDRAFIQILARFEGACVSFETRGNVRRSDQAFGRFTRIRLQLKRNVKQARFESCVGEACPGAASLELCRSAGSLSGSGPVIE